ncbi:ATP-binding response regulator [Vacuolonema iberomarrocanum]|uniref:ATP-binding response regulator n=1 Tax=Vacuolonema iberomarrocanum TaxID=3454632 RepID=UPI0019E9E7E0|nr:response regulator [filamentous cyanobacterium LEGE 07170]
MNQAPIEPLPTPRSGDILLVDDTLDNLRVLTALLNQRGYKVRGVAKGSAALMGAEAQPPDLILLDINMPEMNGYEVCQRLKQNPTTQHIPIIFISALNEVFDKVQAFTIGGVDYITKPFQVEEVFARIENQLAIQRLQTQLRQQNERLQAAEAGLSRALAQERLLNEKIAEMTTLEERHRIARDIHDSLGHALVALNIQLEAALTLWHEAPDKAYESLQESKQLGSDALAAVRTSVTDMRSDTLQGELLEQALEGLIQEFQQATQITPNVHLDLSCPFPNAVNVAAYRIVQEGFTNICKHAQATAVDLTVQTSATELQLTLTDNGKGFCHTPGQAGFGLKGMQERITAVGGTLDIQSLPDKGCQLKACFPRLVR